MSKLILDPNRTALQSKDHSRHRRGGVDPYMIYSPVEMHNLSAKRQAQVDRLPRARRLAWHAIGKSSLIWTVHPDSRVDGPPKPQARGNHQLCKRGQRLAMRLGLKCAKIPELHHELSLEDLGL